MEIQINLAITLDHTSISFENTGKEPLENLKIGLYKSHLKRRRWAFNNAYGMEIPLLEPAQNKSFPLKDFKRKIPPEEKTEEKAEGKKTKDFFSLDESINQYVDCWVHTKNSSHIFQFTIAAKEQAHNKDDL